MEQAKSISNVNPEQFNSEYLRDPAFNERNDVTAEEAKDYPQKRQPALGHKRAFFSLKPSKIYPNETLKPTLDIDHLKDPEEFFMAYERLENAKREIQKQMGGVSFELNQISKSTNARQHRPGLLRNNKWRFVRYKHWYSMGASDNNYHVPSVQEIFESRRQGLADSSLVEQKIDDILNGLQDSSCEDLEKDAAILHLQASLHMRPIILQKSSMPYLPDNQVADLKAFGCSLSKPRKALSNIDNSLKEIHKKTALKHRQDVRGALRQLSSTPPTPRKSPFAPLSSLLKRCSLSRSSVDPFPLLYDDSLPTRNTSVVNQEINLTNSGKPASLIEDVVAVKKTSSVDNNVEKCYRSSGKSKRDNLGKPSSKINTLLIKDVVAVRKTTTVEATRNCASTSEKSNDMDGGIMDDTVCRSYSEVHEENMQEAVASVSRDDPDLTLVNPLDQSTPLELQHNAMDEYTSISDDGEAEQCLKVQGKTKVSKVSVKQRKDKSYSRRERKNKGISRRLSLAAAGTSRKSGVRRSTRIKTRPLEYWKGERLVYGRIHESLATVIGVKYISPGRTDGKPTMKVKSYVSDEHKDLLELASLH